MEKNKNLYRAPETMFLPIRHKRFPLLFWSALQPPTLARRTPKKKREPFGGKRLVKKFENPGPRQ
jgi:hypothetical protein